MIPVQRYLQEVSTIFDVGEVSVRLDELPYFSVCSDGSQTRQRLAEMCVNRRSEYVVESLDLSSRVPIDSEEVVIYQQDRSNSNKEVLLNNGD